MTAGIIRQSAPFIGIELSSIILGGLILIVFGCIIYAIIQQMWPYMWILIAMEAVLIMVTAGACRHAGSASGGGNGHSRRLYAGIKIGNISSVYSGMSPIF